MNFKHILAMFLIVALVLMPTAMAGTGEENVKKVDANGDTTDEGIEHSDDDEEEEDASSDEMGDVWGIKQSDAGFDSLVNINTLGGVYMGFTPFRNMSIITISILGGLAITFVVGGILGLLAWAGVGAAHPNIKKGWDMIRGAQGKIAAIGIVFAMAFFMIILVFFTLTIFGKVIVLMA